MDPSFGPTPCSLLPPSVLCYTCPMSRIATLLTQGILLALALITPWLIGSIKQAVRVWLLAGLLLATACWLITLLTDRPARAVLPGACLPLALLIGLGLLQIVPLDAKTGGLLSPYGTRFRAALLAAPDAAASAQRQPLSLYPASTRYDLAMLTLAAVRLRAGGRRVP